MDEEDRWTAYPVYIVTKHGTIKHSDLQIEDVETNVEPVLAWRKAPRLCCKFSFVQFFSEPKASPILAGYHRVTFQIGGLELILEIRGQDIQRFMTQVREVHKKALKINNMERALKSVKMTQLFAKFTTEATVKEEQLSQLASHLRQREGWMMLERALSKYQKRIQLAAVNTWADSVRAANVSRMDRDRHRWRLHAAANQDIDLQAWYHALFFQEVYRLRGKFFYKDASLPVYRQSYDLMDNALTPLEEAALAHVLCSPDTTYGDVAGQMFIVQALLSAAHYELFQKLASQGIPIIKHPRQGRPAKKLFRFSFVEGNIYLTWKGKFGNQGVGMAEVTEIAAGIQTDVLKWSAQAAKAGQYLSVLCADRSIDLYFETVVERNAWRDVLQTLILKEQGLLIGVSPLVQDAQLAEDDFAWLVLYASIGKLREAAAPLTQPMLAAAQQLMAQRQVC